MSNPKPRNPNQQLNDISPTFVKQTVSELREVYELPPVTTDEEVKQRIYDFFLFCERTSMRPGIELLSLYLGVSRQTLWNWSTGVTCSPERQAMINHAKALIGAYLEQSHLQGKLNPVSAIFLSKCWLGYTEDLTVRLDTQTAHQMPTQTIEELARMHHVQVTELPEKPDLR